MIPGSLPPPRNYAWSCLIDIHWLRSQRATEVDWSHSAAFTPSNFNPKLHISFLSSVLTWDDELSSLPWYRSHTDGILVSHDLVSYETRSIGFYCRYFSHRTQTQVCSCSREPCPDSTMLPHNSFPPICECLLPFLLSPRTEHTLLVLSILCVSCCGEQIGVNIPLVDFKSLYDLDMFEWKVRSTKNGFAISFFRTMHWDSVEAINEAYLLISRKV